MAGTESPGYPGVIAGRNTETEAPDDIGMDQQSRALYVGSWVWNPSTLAWEKLQPPRKYFVRIEDMLEEMVLELKKMNEYLSILSNGDIRE
jgi:hypothetical protein